MKCKVLWSRMPYAVSIVMLWSTSLLAQTTSGTSATIVVPVIAQTPSFGSEVTAYNPNVGAITVNVSFYDAENTASPGPKTCTALSLPAGRSAQFSVAGQCALPAGSNFGLLILTEQTGTQRFYGYARTQTPGGVGFSTEGFPIENFNDQLQHATGIKRLAAGGGLPAFQTNCFVGTLGDAVSYELRLFNGTTNAQIGSTLAGSLQPYQQFRYLDVFAQAGAPAGDLTNVRAEFTNLTAADKKLIGFCTVQENTTFSADFRIAKSYGGTPQNAFVQGGNAFGVTALLGTTDNQPLEIKVNNGRVMRYEPDATSPNVLAGHPNNIIGAGSHGSTIAGGGLAGNNCYEPLTGQNTRPCANRAGGSLDHFATISGGHANLASGWGTVAGGVSNTASAFGSMVAGGAYNTASAPYSFAAGDNANADQSHCALFALWSNTIPFTCQGVNFLFRIGADHGLDVSYFSRVGAGGSRFVYIGDFYAGDTLMAWSGAHLTNGGAWTNASDRDSKENFAPIDARKILARAVALPVMQWSYKAEPGIKRIGPVAQDFYAAFGLGPDDKGISTVDEGGVALAAIQGLHQMVLEKDARIAALENALGELKRVVEALAKKQ